VIIGVPHETERLEHRVGLTPFAVARLVAQGHVVVVERGAGAEARFKDSHYTEAGAEIVYTAEEIYKRADLVCQVGGVPRGRLDLLKRGSLLCGFHHLAVAPRPMLEKLMALEATLIGYEIVADENGDRPILLPMSDLAGQMAIHVAAELLQIQAGGRGILLGNTPGVPAATVLILGAGQVGTVAARLAAALGAHVLVMDADLRKLQRLSAAVHGRVETALMGEVQLARFVGFADVLIGAVLNPGERTPFLVSEAMVRSMKAGSVIVDVSIDQGGCVETSRPTMLDQPTYRVHDVVHYCVPNMTSDIARTASRVMSDAAMPYLLEIAERGLEAALSRDAGLARGLYLYRGRPVHDAVAELMGVPCEPLGSLLPRGSER
jgi:alanine dehydrogenase